MLQMFDFLFTNENLEIQGCQDLRNIKNLGRLPSRDQILIYDTARGTDSGTQSARTARQNEGTKCDLGARCSLAAPLI